LVALLKNKNDHHDLMAGATKTIKPAKPLKVKKILCTQPRPDSDKSPYFDIEKKYKVKIDFIPITGIEGVDSKEFRKQKIYLQEYSGIIFQSRNAIDNFFRICAEMRHTMPEMAKYYCISESIALYLQKYIQYRKRKVFYGNGKLDDLKDLLKKHKENERFLYACSTQHTDDLVKHMTDNGFSFREGAVFSPVFTDVRKTLTNIEAYDLILFFSPTSVKSVKHNFKRYKQGTTRIAVFGPQTAKACDEEKLRIDIKAPTPEFPSMTMACEDYLKKTNK